MFIRTRYFNNWKGKKMVLAFLLALKIKKIRESSWHLMDSLNVPTFCVPSIHIYSKIHREQLKLNSNRGRRVYPLFSLQFLFLNLEWKPFGFYKDRNFVYLKHFFSVVSQNGNLLTFHYLWRISLNWYGWIYIFAVIQKGQYVSTTT